MSWNSTLKRGTSQLKRSQMKTTGKRKAATKQERAYMSAQADAGCVLCRYLGYGDTPAEIHHLRDGVGAGQRNSNLKSIPLCSEHHRGNTGYHGLGRRAFEREYRITELELLALSQETVTPATDIAGNKKPALARGLI